MSRDAVVVTGASTGIGRATALHLDRADLRVFAGVRKREDADDLSDATSGRVTPLMLDVADQASISAAVDELTQVLGTGRLRGLVNNAGITVQGPLEYLALDDLRRQFEVNVVGQIAVTQAFLPLLRAARGRIVFMSSIAGRASSLPFLGPYSASKKAIEALADSLRVELASSGIKVSLVEPGSIATPIWEKGDAAFDDLIDALPPEGRAFYEPALLKARRLAGSTGARGIPAERVAEKVEHALMSRAPKTRYLVGIDAKARAWLEPALPDRLRDKVVARTVGLGPKD